MSATHWTLFFSWLQLLTNDDDDSMLPSFAITGTATVVAVFSHGLVFKYILQMKTARWEEMTGISGSSSPFEVRRKYFCTEVLQRHRCISTVHRCHHCHRCTSTSTYFARIDHFRVAVGFRTCRCRSIFQINISWSTMWWFWWVVSGKPNQNPITAALRYILFVSWQKILHRCCILSQLTFFMRFTYSYRKHLIATWFRWNYWV